MDTYSEQELDQILAECYNSTELFCMTFFPHLFYRPFSEGHRKIFELLDDDSKQRVVIAAPRGFGKSTIIEKAFPAKKILYKDTRYMIPVSCTSEAAVEHSENLKRELEENEMINLVFGDSKGSDTYSTKEWITKYGAKVLPRGAEQQIRGRLFGYSRPDLFIIDDLEDDESVLSEERRMKRKNWFFSSVVNSVDRGSDNWRIIVIGTVLHEDSLLSNLLDDPEWESVRLEICDDNYNTLWPEFISSAEVMKLADGYRNRGMLDVFYREYRNIPISLEDQGIKPEMFEYYEESERKLNTDKDVETIILADPAKTITEGSCSTAIVGVGINVKTNEWFVRDIIEEKLHPDELYEKMFDMAERLNAFVLAPEVTSLNEYITYPLMNEMQRRGLHYIIIEVKPRQGKTGPKRSGGLVPMYRQGLIKHNRRVCGKLERMLLQWPRPSSWDIIDALSGMIYVLDEGERYFMPMESDEDIESEYEEIDNEPEILDFRVI